MTGPDVLETALPQPREAPMPFLGGRTNYDRLNKSAEQGVSSRLVGEMLFELSSLEKDIRRRIGQRIVSLCTEGSQIPSQVSYFVNKLTEDREDRDISIFVKELRGTGARGLRSIVAGISAALVDPEQRQRVISAFENGFNHNIDGSPETERIYLKEQAEAILACLGKDNLQERIGQVEQHQGV